MIDVNKSFLTKEQSTIIKGILILLVVLGHNGILMGKAQHLSVNSFNDFLYTFHVYAFLFLPFLYNIPEQSICRIKKNFIHLYKPYTVFFIILLIAFWVINKSFDVPGVVYAYISASEPVLKQYVGASFLWFLPTMFSLLILRDSLMNTKIGLLLVSLGSFIFLVLYSVFGIIPWECNQISVMGIFTAFRIFCLAVFSRILLMLAEQDKRIKWLYIGLGVVTSVSFFLFKNLETIDLSYLDTSKVINMTYMFGSLNTSLGAALPLTELDLSNFDTRNVTNMYGMFSCLGNLQNIIFGENFDTSNVTNMSRMFYYLASIESIDVSGFDTSNVIYMLEMFSRCEKLKELDLTNFDTSKVVTMEEMFWSTSSLTKVLVSDKWIVNEETNINGMFTNSGVNQVTKA